MPNDAKLGLVVGVGLVITIAVVFYHKDFTAAPGTENTPAAVSPVAPSSASPRGQYRPVRAKAAGRTENAEEKSTESPEPEATEPAITTSNDQ
ncbi:MAG: hypothetical protein K2R98_09355 [Gemmataceae bacterium]|nr:hypothetical protein [Gemmataceae bacterium]